LLSSNQRGKPWARLTATASGSPEGPTTSKAGSGVPEMPVSPACTIETWTRKKRIAGTARYNLILQQLPYLHSIMIFHDVIDY
jgi:hypothetical protein